MLVIISHKHPILGYTICVEVPTNVPFFVKKESIIGDGKNKWRVNKIEHAFDNCFGDSGRHHVNLAIEPIDCEKYPIEGMTLEVME